MKDQDPHDPAASDGSSAEDLVDRTEHLADRALDRVRHEAALPDVREEARSVRATFANIHSRFLGAVLLLYVATAAVGVALAVTQGISDWFMHGAMYVVVLSFIVIYVKAHLQRRRLTRAFYALVCLGLMAFFAWVLHDMVPERLQLEGDDVVTRPSLPVLEIPVVMLVASAAGLAFHWLVLARFRDREVA